ncbi:hypothetical protein RBA63_07065 [Brenneria goodwinii]|uniref:hypothetical protein n=1 Tax=Brenneria goodwinii TaxID=1109412 RepID=UPI0036E50E35
MGKKKKALVYSVTVIIFFLIIPEIILRTLTPEHLAWLGFVTSFGGVISPLLSVMIFMGILSIVLAIATVFFAGKIYRSLSHSDNK